MAGLVDWTQLSSSTFALPFLETCVSESVCCELMKVMQHKKVSLNLSFFFILGFYFFGLMSGSHKEINPLNVEFMLHNDTLYTFLLSR